MKSLFQTIARFLIIVCLLAAAVGAAQAQTTEFTYQGKLNDNSMPPTGSYDFQLKLFNAPSGGTQIGATQILTGISVTGGIFTVRVSFGYGGAVFDGAATFLEIAVKRSADADYTTLAPRQRVTSAPYSIRSLQASSALSAVDSMNLGGFPASQYAFNTDPRLTDSRNPVAGSSNYIQNQTAQTQLSAGFNIGGDGVTSGTFSGNIINAGTQFNLSNNRVLSQPGANNLFVGGSAGAVNTGDSNTFLGVGTGGSNTTGRFNAFVGTSAGQSNTTGRFNTFVGGAAGAANSTGNFNSFFGQNSGSSNNGSQNSFFGYEAGLSNTIAVNNAFFGYEAGEANTQGNGNSFFGSQAGLRNTMGRANSFFGTFAGLTNSIGESNSFFGADAGRLNTEGNFNSFFGVAAGYGNTIGSNNAFFGFEAGLSNTEGDFNSFFGHNAGRNGMITNRNSFFGANAGMLTAGNLGNDNSFFGYNAGANNLNGNSNTFVGNESGQSNTLGAGNVFVGYRAGRSNTDGVRNTVIGFNATTLNTTLFIQNSTAIGNEAVVSQSDSLVLGGTGLYKVNVGINTTAPKARLHIVSGKIYVESNGQGVILKSPSGSCFEITVSNSGALTTTAVTCP